MQEEMTNQAFEIGGKAVSLVLKCTDVTIDILHDLMKSLLENDGKNAQQLGIDQKIKQGKQSVKDLIGQGEPYTDLDLGSSDIKLFDSSARKFGVDYAPVVDKSTDPPTHTIFFKGKDTSAITSAFKDFVDKSEKNLANDKQKSVNKQLKKLQAEIKKKDISLDGKEMAKELGKANRGEQIR